MRGSLRVAIAGAGFIGTVHANAARRAGATIVGVAASTPPRAAQAARRLGAAAAFDSAEDLVEADGVDVVHLCTPNHLHLPLAQRALAAGKHVICEKPLALDLDGARTLAAAAGGSPQQALVPFVYRYYPTVREARHRVAAGLPGAVSVIHGTYLQDWLLRAEDDNWRVDAALGGASRAFADIGSHWCDLAEFVTGHRLTRLSARTTTTVPDRRHTGGHAAFARTDGAPQRDGGLRPVTTEDAAIVQFETDGGALGAVVVSQVAAGRKNRLWLEVDGAREALAFDQEAPEELWCGRQDAATLVRRDPAALSPAAARLAVLPAGHPQGYQDCFDLFVSDAYAAVRGAAPPDGLPRFADGLRAAQITDAVLASARQERWVDVPAAVALGAAR
jgi:predicted dehydrogenase